MVVICLDSVRKDYFDQHAPRLRHAADLVYEQCRAASSWSVPSHASMLTGTLPSEHGVHTYNRDFTALDRSETWLEATGHDTVAVSANLYASSKFGFDTLFDEMIEVSRHHRYADGLNVRNFYYASDADGAQMYAKFFQAALSHNNPIKSLANGVLARLKTFTESHGVSDLIDDGATAVYREAKVALRERDIPTMMFINVMDAHLPLKPFVGYSRLEHSVPWGWTTSDTDLWAVIENPSDHETYIRNLRELYSCVIHYLDRKTLNFIRDIERITERETTVIVTADHGENLGYESEGRLVGHKSSMSEGLLHVPFMIFNAPSTGATEQYLSHLRLGDYVTKMSNGKLPDLTESAISAELIGMGGGSDPPSNMETSYWNRMIRCLYNGNTKFEWDSLGNATRYRLNESADMQQNEHEPFSPPPELASKFFSDNIETCKRQSREGSAVEDSVGEATAERLADLGYM